MVNIIIGGDLVPTTSNQEFFINGDIETLIGKKLINKLENSDFIAMNLEVPLVDIANPIKKAGPNLIASSDAIKGIKKINPYFFTLANNHILDQGEDGLTSTINLLKDNGINYSGVGENVAEASKSFTFMKNGIRVGIYCCSEHEFSVATKKKAGANPYDPLESFDHIEDLSKKVDFVIVLFHGGKEYYRYPSPEIQRIFRKFADKGAHVVIAQHTHCIGCFEKWNNALLVYGQGNFLFDGGDDEYWNSSLLIELELENQSYNYKFIPIIKHDNVISIEENQQSEKIIKDFFKRSNNISKDGFIEEQYKEFAKYMSLNYFKILKGNRSIFNKIAVKIFKNSKLLYNEEKILATLNYIECEAHRELAIQAFKNLIIQK